MPEQNRLLQPQFTPGSREWYMDRLYGTGEDVNAGQKRADSAEFVASMAPVTGEVISARDAWDSSGRGANALLQGNYGDAAGEYGNMLLGVMGAIPGAGVVARGTKRGAAWMDRNLPAGFNRLLDAAMPSDPKNTLPAFPAWHGSPHDFDEFKLDKIGTGEGAQAYGHGLYFAENPAVAKDYQKQLTNRVGVSYRMQDGTTYTPQDADTPIAFNAILDNNQSVDDWLKWTPEEMEIPEVRRMVEAIKKHGPPVERTQSNTGRLYRTEIDAEPEDLLDWDKPLSEQGELGQRAQKLMDEHGLTKPELSETDKLFAGLFDLDWENGGASLYKALENKYGRAGASQALREAGIPGIRYLDQGSRGAGEGTANYVIFDDKLVKITGKE